MGYYDTATDYDLDAILVQLVEQMGAENVVFQIPGVYEIVKEHFNNEMLDEFVKENPPDEDYLREKGETRCECDGDDVRLICDLTDELLVEWAGDNVPHWVELGVLNRADFHGSAYEHYEDAHSEGVRDFPLTYGRED